MDAAAARVDPRARAGIGALVVMAEESKGEEVQCPRSHGLTSSSAGWQTRTISLARGQPRDEWVGFDIEMAT